MTSSEICGICGKEICDNEWTCLVELNRREGNKEHLPNNLPVTCIRADGLMLECEHGDHPDYLFPVECKYVGKDPNRHKICEPDGNEREMTEEEKGIYASDYELHALIYTDGHVALTLYETCYYFWYLDTGFCANRPLCEGEEEGWQLSDESRNKIKEYLTNRPSR